MASRRTVGFAPWVIAFATACGGGDDPEIVACEGGGVASLVVGLDGPGGFAALEEGDPVPISEDGTGTYLLRLDFQATGLDTTQPATANLRLWYDGDSTSEDYLGAAQLSCQGDGPARWGAFASLPAVYQSASAVAALDGAPLHIEAVLADTHGAAADAILDVVLEAPVGDSGG